ncbi:angiotensin-converting enzyme-like [Anthonomus grandis grandis]|uniref:angiotensin-converting enzyme-like n=1 Tax=Anthonomus grandis grandis TaxID=2921223 RepID=UPI002165BFF5|nr:angiotensin-converting enzyme-like [Anthonomus grandis grandis]
MDEISESKTKLFCLKYWRIFVGAFIALFLVVCFALMIYRIVIHDQELKGMKLIEELGEREHQDITNLAYLEFAYQINVTDENLKAKNQMMDLQEKHAIDAFNQASQFNYKLFYNETLIHEFERFVKTRSLPTAKLERLRSLIDIMQEVQSSTEICSNKEKNGQSNCGLGLEDISDILEDPSAELEEKKHVWVQYHNKVGHQLKRDFQEYVRLTNENSVINGYGNAAEEWNSDMNEENFREMYENLYESLHPLYLQLHAYVRRKLREKYGDLLTERGPIPTHLLGDLWGQSWTSIINFTMPYPEETQINITKEMLNKGYTVKRMFEMAEDFFVSMNLSHMTKNFKKKSMFLKPKDRKVICHPTAWDFYTQDDFRISMCARVRLKDFIDIHHEMGHIQYFMEYRHQRMEYRDGANSGFHEAIGDLIAASVQSLRHLKKVGLVLDAHINKGTVVNQLYKTGLYQVAFLPFSYLTDIWRWDIFEGKIKPKDYNCYWWQLKEKYQGLEPAAERKPADFDPVTKYHVAADIPYIRYFVSVVLQYQLLKALCKIAGEFRENDPKKLLSECDLHGHKEAGNVLKKMLAMGSSQPWNDALEVVTNQRKMDVSGLLQYFKPLHDWLIKDNEKNHAYIGWEHSKVKIKC